MMGKKYIFISDAFQVLFFPAECWCIYRIKGECLRVTSSGAAFWATRKLQIMQEKVYGRGQAKAKSSRTQTGLLFHVFKISAPSSADKINAKFVRVL